MSADVRPRRRVVVVGGGLAGARTCEELRLQGFDGEVALVGAEPHRPYDRPPLSKAVLLAGDDAVPGVTLDTAWDELGVDLRLGVTATALRPGRLSTTDGEMAYDDLVLALGAEPVRLSGMDGVRTLRTVDDAVALRGLLRPGARVVVVGAGWIGAEVATAAAARGCAVTVVEAGPAPLATAVGAQVGARTVPWYAAAGVDLRLGDPVVRTERGAVVLRDAGRLAADVVVAAVGVRPRLGWLEDSGLELADGVVTDAAGRTALHGVWAVGDCARRWSPRAGRLVRTEHWDDALHAPAALVTALLGGTAAHDPVPYVWSEQFGRVLQWVGWRRGEPTLWRGDPPSVSPSGSGPGWAAAWLDERGRLFGFVGVDRPLDVRQARRAIAAGATPDPARLADPATVVRDA